MARDNLLTAREQRFAMYVGMRGEKPADAMLKAGYAASTVKRMGTAFLLRRPRVRKEIERYLKTQEERPPPPAGKLKNLPKELRSVLLAKALTPEQFEEVRKCAAGRKGQIYWLKKYVWTWDRAKKRKAQYPLWPYQRKFLKELEDGGRILAEKTRDIMMTWTVCEHCLWHLQFDPFWTGFATSRRQAEVDNGGASSTTASIFGRIRFSWEEQPEWLRMAFHFSLLKIINEEEGMYAEMLGESANPDVGRSSDAYFKWGDEFALVEQSERAHASMIGGGFNTLLYTSTSNLTGNEFYRLRSKEGSGFRVLRYSWELVPGRDKKWYDDKVASLTDEQRAKEIDIQYEISGPRLIWKKFDPRIHTRVREKMPIGVGRAFLGYDEGYAHPGALYYARYWEGTLYIIDEIYEAGVHLLLPDEIRDKTNKDWVWYMEELIKKHGPIEMICVGNESRGLESLLVAKDYPVYRVGKDRLNRIRLIDGLMRETGEGRPGLIVDQELMRLLKEIPKYRWKVIAGFIQDWPADGEDHGCDAIMDIAEYVLANKEEEESSWVSQI